MTTELDRFTCGEYLAQQLAERGYKRETMFRWFIPCNGPAFVTPQREFHLGMCGCRVIPAPGTDELGEDLSGFDLAQIIKTGDSRWEVSGGNSSIYKKEADARAELLVSLLESRNKS